MKKLNLTEATCLALEGKLTEDALISTKEYWVDDSEGDLDISVDISKCNFTKVNDVSYGARSISIRFNNPNDVITVDKKPNIEVINDLVSDLNKLNNWSLYIQREIDDTVYFSISAKDYDLNEEVFYSESNLEYRSFIRKSFIKNIDEFLKSSGYESIRYYLGHKNKDY